MPTIAVLGSTGAQGGSVINQLSRTGAWKIRAVTRNTNVAWVREHAPGVWARTSQVWPGWYPSNLATLPMGRFVEIPHAGYLEHNLGVVVEALLDAGERAFGRHVACVTDYLSFQDVARLFEEVTGRTAAYAEVSDDVFGKLHGVFGDELRAQFRWGEVVPDWDQIEAEDTLTLEQLGVRDKLVGFRATLEGMKEKIV